MPHTLKIATCCYCGTRAALVLDRVRHELSCRACGAPLHEMKMLRKQDVDDAQIGAQVRRDRPSMAKMAVGKTKKHKKCDAYDRRPTRRKDIAKRKPRNRWARKFMEELWDVVEDVFD